jgi:hypothetical protein
LAAVYSLYPNLLKNDRLGQTQKSRRHCVWLISSDVLHDSKVQATIEMVVEYKQGFKKYYRMGTNKLKMTITIWTCPSSFTSTLGFVSGF